MKKSRLIFVADILHFLTFTDLILFSSTNQNPNIDDFKELCRVNNGDLFEYFPKSIRSKKEYVKYAIENSIQGRTLIRFVPFSIRYSIWDSMYSENLLEYEKGLNSIINKKEIVPKEFVHYMNSDDFAFVALRENGIRLKQMNMCKIKKKRFLVTVALLENGNALKYIPYNLKDDLNLVSLCVNKFPYALEHASPFCINNEKIIEIATAKVKWVHRFCIQT
tara:strand:- start:1291 stop:1953 length:663 start_codon:yes stop_codon:yes gene_type:complete